jgi:hypothetical protein
VVLNCSLNFLKLETIQTIKTGIMPINYLSKILYSRGAISTLNNEQSFNGIYTME